MKLRRNVLQPLRIVFDDIDSATQVQPPASGPTANGELLASRCKADYNATAHLGAQHATHRPTALLEQYSRHRSDSVVGHLFHVANRIHATVDSVVVLCGADAALGAEAIAQSCTQPYWNHLSRAERGSKPRIFFIDDQSDNDSIQGLLHLLGAHRPTTRNSHPEDWALVVLSAEDEPDHAMWQLEPLLNALKRQFANEPEQIAQRVIAVAPSRGSIAEQVRAIGSRDVFPCYEEPAPLQCFGPLGLLPATLMGVNIMELLAGASWMSKHFHTTALDENLVLRFLGWQSRCESVGRFADPVQAWNPGLEAWQRWHCGLVKGFGQGAICSEGRYDVRIVIDRPKFDPIHFADGTTAPDRLQHRMDRHAEALQREKIPRAAIHLGELDELHVGQLMQWMLLVSSSSKLGSGDSPILTCDHSDASISPETDG